jgi:hypothetical protein
MMGKRQGASHLISGHSQGQAGSSRHFPLAISSIFCRTSPQLIQLPSLSPDGVAITISFRNVVKASTPLLPKTKRSSQRRLSPNPILHSCQLHPMFFSSPSPFLNGERPEANAWGNGSLCVKKIKEGDRLQPPMSSKLRGCMKANHAPRRISVNALFPGVSRGSAGWWRGLARFWLLKREPQQALKTRKTVSHTEVPRLGKSFKSEIMEVGI